MSDELPPGWSAHTSSTYNRKYYLHVDGTRTWTRPSYALHLDQQLLQSVPPPPDCAFVTFLLHALAREVMADTDWFQDTPALSVVRTLGDSFSTMDAAHAALVSAKKNLTADRAAFVVPDAELWRSAKRMKWGRLHLNRDSPVAVDYGDRASLQYDKGALRPMWWVSRSVLCARLDAVGLEIASDFNLVTFGAWLGIDTLKDATRQFIARTEYAERETADRVEWAEASFYRIFVIRPKGSLVAGPLCRHIRAFEDLP